MANRKVWTCKRCGHRWMARKPYKPAVCPACKSPRWTRSK